MLNLLYTVNKQQPQQPFHITDPNLLCVFELCASSCARKIDI